MGVNADKYDVRTDIILLNRWTDFRQSPIGEAVETVVLASALALFLRIFVLQAYFIPSNSMNETLEPNDHILAEKLSLHIKTPARGKVLIFNLDGEAKNDFAVTASGVKEITTHKEYVKRLIGKPGDEIEFIGSRINLNGQTLEEPYVHISSLSANHSSNFALIIKGRDLNVIKDKVFIDKKPIEEVLPQSIPASAINDRSISNFVKLNGNRIGVRKIRVPEGKYYFLGDNRMESADSRYFGFVDEAGIDGKAVCVYWPLSRLRLL